MKKYRVYYTTGEYTEVSGINIIEAVSEIPIVDTNNVKSIELIK